MDRRQVRLALISGGTQILTRTNPGPVAAEWTAEKWMDTWMAGRRLPIGALHLFRFKDPFYVLTSPIAWKPNADQDPTLEPVEVPKGFVTDLASVPRIFWSYLRPDGNYAYAAIIHDYLYWVQSRAREAADLVFK